MPTTSSGTPRRTLLIVDDEEGPRQSLRVVFRNEYDLLIAADGPTAIDMAQDNRIDVAILDIRMQGMSGIEVLQGLKTVDPHIEVIMLTAYEDIDSVRKALRLGACDYLNKPFELAPLRTAVSKAMTRRTLSFEVKSNNEKLKELSHELEKHRLDEEELRSRGEIFAAIIHDINGPLTIMSGFLQLINQRIGNENRIEGEELENVKDRLRRITKQVTNCIEISRRYLRSMRPDAHENMRISINQSLMDLGELMRVHPAMGSNDLVIAPMVEDAMVQINGTDLIQALRNLSVNALQATDERHRVEIRGAILSEPLAPQSLEEGPDQRFIQSGEFTNTVPLLALSVSDNGPGISVENMAKIFSQSFTSKEEGKGTGLGLSIVQRLILRAKGAIQVRSKVGQGTRFTIYLPLQ